MLHLSYMRYILTKLVKANNNINISILNTNT